MYMYKAMASGGSNSDGHNSENMTEPFRKTCINKLNIVGES